MEYGTKIVDGVKIPTRKETMVDFNMLEVEAGTNGYQGGDTGHGGRTYFRIVDGGCTDMTVNRYFDRYGDSVGFEVFLGGDAELRTMIDALKFIVQTLEEQIHDGMD